MHEIHDERRQEPRFRAAGSATFKVGRRDYRALVLDLSLNGLKVTRPEGFAPLQGDRFRLALTVAGGDPFVAEVKVMHSEPGLLGLEFYDMPPRDFGVLAGLIEQYQKLKRYGQKPA